MKASLLIALALLAGCEKAPMSEKAQADAVAWCREYAQREPYAITQHADSGEVVAIECGSEADGIPPVYPPQ